MPLPSFQFYQVTSGSDRPCFCPADKSRTFPEKHSFRVRRQRQETSANDNCHSNSGRSAFHHFTTLMADDHASKIVRTEMNECLNLGSGEGRANDRFWVSLREGAR
jgi:hypothetical protein